MKDIRDLLKLKYDALTKVRASLLRDIDKTTGAIEVIEKLIEDCQEKEEDYG